MAGIHETLERVEQLYRTQQDAIAKLDRAVASLERWQREAPTAHAQREYELKQAHDRLMVQVDQIYATLSRLHWMWFFVTFAISAIGGTAASFVILGVLR